MVTSAGITGYEKVAFEEDRMLLVGNNGLGVNSGFDYWRRFDYSTSAIYAVLTDTDADNATFPPAHGVDGEGSTFTAPTLIAGSSGYGFISELTGGTVTLNFDVFFLQMMDLNGLGSGSVYVHVADDVNFTGGVEQIASFSTGGVSNRLVSTSMGSGSIRYTVPANQGHALQVSFVPSGGDYTASTLPSIIHCQVGKRLQLWREPNMLENYDLSYSAEQTVRMTESGRPVGVVHNAGGKSFEISWSFEAVLEDYLSDALNMETFIGNDISYGADPFIFIKNPSSGAADALRGIIEEDTLEMPATASQRTLSFRFVEISPFSAAER